MSDLIRMRSLADAVQEGHAISQYVVARELHDAADQAERLRARVEELEKDAARYKRRLSAMLPLFEEARDALPAISETARRLHSISTTLADRMDQVGDPKRWAALAQQEGEG